MQTCKLVVISTQGHTYKEVMNEIEIEMKKHGLYYKTIENRGIILNYTSVVEFILDNSDSIYTIATIIYNSLKCKDDIREILTMPNFTTKSLYNQLTRITNNSTLEEIANILSAFL